MSDETRLLQGIVLPCIDLAHMIAGGSLQNTDERTALDEFLGATDEEVVIVPKSHLDRLISDHQQMLTQLEQEYQMLKSYTAETAKEVSKP